MTDVSMNGGGGRGCFWRRRCLKLAHIRERPFTLLHAHANSSFSLFFNGHRPYYNINNVEYNTQHEKIESKRFCPINFKTSIRKVHFLSSFLRDKNDFKSL